MANINVDKILLKSVEDGATASYTPLERELVCNRPGNVIKIGDGVKTFENLPAIGGSGGASLDLPPNDGYPYVMMNGAWYRLENSKLSLQGARTSFFLTDIDGDLAAAYYIRQINGVLCARRGGWPTEADAQSGDLASYINANAKLSTDVFFIANGEYKISATITLPYQVSIYGGYPADITDTTDINSVVRTAGTVIDAQGKCQVINCADASVLDGLEITGGDTSSAQGSNASGVTCASTLTLRNCKVSKNVTGAGIYIGGIYCRGGTFVNCVISDNSATGGTGTVVCGGVKVQSAASSFTDCTISGNSGNGNGVGGIYTTSAPMVFRNCVIKANNCAVTNNGAGGVLSSSALEFINCAFIGNIATGITDHNYLASAVFIDRNNGLILINCTVAKNSASSAAAVVVKDTTSSNGSDSFINCTFHGNSTTNNTTPIDIYFNFKGNATIANSIVPYHKTGTNSPTLTIKNSMIKLPNQGTNCVALDLPDALDSTILKINNIAQEYYELPTGSAARGAGLAVGTSLGQITFDRTSRNLSTPADDQLGRVRPTSGGVDIGAWQH